MLPLWIIDVREKSARRDEFQRLLGQIDHVSMADESDCCSSHITDTAGLQDSPDSRHAHAAQDNHASTHGENGNAPHTPEKIREEIDRHDRDEADRNARIDGCYWHYSVIDASAYDIDFPANGESAHEARATAQKFYDFQSNLVAQGQQFIRMLRQSNAHADIKINIVVLGDLSEKFTRLVFPAIAGLLQKEKGRMLPHHIHQGMEVIGMLFIPSDLNTRHVAERKSMLRTLREIDVQHHVNDLRGYDHMMFYQDVPNRTECVYPLLSDKAIAEYLMQCLVHLYLACNDSHPLLSGTSSADVFYFSMGATSVHFDTQYEDEKTRYRMATDFIKAIKSDGDNKLFNLPLHLIADEEYLPDSFFRYDSLSMLEVDEQPEEPNPHPVRDFFARNLKRYYYNSFLRYYSTNLMRRITNTIERNTKNALDTVATESRRTFSDASKRLFERIREALGHLSSSDGGIPAMTALLKEMQESLAEKRKRIRPTLKSVFWRNIEENHVPRAMSNDFMDYHDAFMEDQASKSGDTAQNEIKKQAVKDLNSILSRESTFMSRICRSVLLGIVGAIAIIPVLCSIPPYIIDLGDVYANRYWWAAAFFILPALVQCLSYLRYMRAKKRAVRRLHAIFLHDAFARVANRIELEINSFYDKMTALAEKYIQRCDKIRKELGNGLRMEHKVKPLFPESMFNQPLIAGQFGLDMLLPESEADDTEVRINYIRYPFKEIGKPEYFIFMNQHKEMVGELFRDVALTESVSRHIDDNGMETLLSKEQQEAELEKQWEIRHAEFYSHLHDAVADAILPRENDTVGEKLTHYCRVSPDRVDSMRCAIDFAVTNGEITSSADREYADIKLNDSRAEHYILPYISTTYKKSQVDRFNPVYSKYIFITRWRCFEQLNLNRILPTEDFDEKMRIRQVFSAEQAEKARMERDRANGDGGSSPYPPTESVGYSPRPSSLLLWALCLEDSSTEWFRLFDSEQFAKAYSDKKIYRECLNQND